MKGTIPVSPVRNDVGCQSRGCEVDPRIGQNSFLLLTRDTVIGIMFFTNGSTVYVETIPVVLERLLCLVLVWGRPGNTCVGKPNIVETALNLNQSINLRFRVGNHLRTAKAQVALVR